ncbi:MAG: hydrogenase maturation protease [Verrucomicrobiota bacterium]|nr:hydrogenase maturation protease [Limisphaera sp.]MDW8381781.1 hydrogenase maturation protease [Verrucomicrobiota bacterium]
MSILIIGYGNCLRRDDGLGFRLAEALAEPSLPGVEVVACHQLVPELAERLTHVSAVLFMDAIQEQRARVRVRRLILQPVQAGWAHEFGPLAVLALARDVYAATPPAWLMTLPGADFSLGEGFSKLGVESFNRGLDRAKRWLRQQQKLWTQRP